MQIQPINESYHITPLFSAMKQSTDRLPKTSLPTETEGTVQENAQALPAVTLYNSHGILLSSNPNSLIAYA